MISLMAIFKQSFTFICLVCIYGEWICLCYDAYVEVRLAELSSLIPLCGSRGLDVSHQVWWQASLTNGLSLWRQLRAILMNVGLKTLSKETCCYSEDLYDLVK